MMTPTLQLKPRLQSMRSLLLILIRPRKFNYGYPFNNASIPDVPRCFAMNRSVNSITPVPTRSASQQAWKHCSVKEIDSLISPPPSPPSLTSKTRHTHRLFASHEITFFCSSLIYKEVMFTLLQFCRNSECELSGHQKPDRQNPSRTFDQALRDIPMCWSSVNVSGSHLLWSLGLSSLVWFQ